MDLDKESYQGPREKERAGEVRTVQSSQTHDEQNGTYLLETGPTNDFPIIHFALHMASSDVPNAV